MNKNKTPESIATPVKPEKVYIICLFTLENHTKWRMLSHQSQDQIEIQLKTVLEKNNITAKKFFKVDRMKGTISELP